MTVDSETHARIPPKPSPFKRDEVASRNKQPSTKPADRRLMIAGPVVALVSLLAAVLTTDAAGLPLRDPDHVAGAHAHQLGPASRARCTCLRACGAPVAPGVVLTSADSEAATSSEVRASGAEAFMPKDELLKSGA